MPKNPKNGLNFSFTCVHGYLLWTKISTFTEHFWPLKRSKKLFLSIFA
jgi:hypothetical protein